MWFRSDQCLTLTLYPDGRLSGFAKATKTSGAVLEAIKFEEKPSCVGVLKDPKKRFSKNLQIQKSNSKFAHARNSNNLVVQKLRREFTHAQNFLFKIPAQVRACADSRRDFWTTNGGQVELAESETGTGTETETGMDNQMGGVAALGQSLSSS